MKPTKDDIRRRLGLREVPKPPEDLARRIKADIPASFRYREQVSAGRKGNGPTAASWGLSWQVAASFLALTVIGVGIYMTTFESQNAETAATIAEADGQTAMEFAPPTAPMDGPEARAAEAPKLKSQQAAPAASPMYDIAAAPPPPPRAQNAAVGVEGGTEGRVEGGVLGGVIGEGNKAPVGKSDDFRTEAIEKSRDQDFAEEKESAMAAAAPQPAAMAEPGRRDAKDEQVKGMGVAQSTIARPAAPAETRQRANDDGMAYSPLRVGGDVKAPVIVKRVELVYPAGAKKAGIQGIVIVEAIIDRNGDVKDVKVLKSLPMGLDAAAVTAIKQWKFIPGTLNGRPVDVIFNLTVNAKLAR